MAKLINGYGEDLLSKEEFGALAIFYDRIAEHPRRFRELDTEDPEVWYHEPEEGRLIQAGTPLSANTFNPRDHAIWSLYIMIDNLLNRLTDMSVGVGVIDGATGTDSFVLLYTDFIVYEGWIDELNQRVVM